MPKEIHPRLKTLLLNEAGIPKRLHDIRLEEFKPSRDQREAYQGCQDFVTNLRDHYISPHRPQDEYPEDRTKIGRGILLVGGPGTGKTTLAALTVQEIFLTYRLPVRFIAQADYYQARLDQIRAEKANDMEEANRLDTLTRSIRMMPVVCLDDLSKERQTASGFSEHEVDAMLRARYRDAHPTIVTSNLPLSEWGARYNESMESFLHEAFDVFVVAGKDWRV